MPAALAPRLWAGHLVALAAVVVAGMLGLWQFDAWQERRDAQAQDLTQVEPVALESVLGPDDPFPGDRVGQPVTVGGTWLGAGTVFVSGRERDGVDGYWMTSILSVQAEGVPDAAIPVVLGWTADPAAAPPTPTGSAQVTGYLQPPEGTGDVDADPNDDVVPQLRTADLIQLIDEDLYGAYVVDRAGIGSLPAADLAALPEPSRFTALRNFFYGIEWWTFGAFALFIWWRWVRDSTRVPQPDQVASQP